MLPKIFNFWPFNIKRKKEERKRKKRLIIILCLFGAGVVLAGAAIGVVFSLQGGEESINGFAFGDDISKFMKPWSDSPTDQTDYSHAGNWWVNEPFSKPIDSADPMNEGYITTIFNNLSENDVWNIVWLGCLYQYLDEMIGAAPILSLWGIQMILNVNSISWVDHLLTFDYSWTLKGTVKYEMFSGLGPSFAVIWPMIFGDRTKVKNPKLTNRTAVPIPLIATYNHVKDAFDSELNFVFGKYLDSSQFPIEPFTISKVYVSAKGIPEKEVGSDTPMMESERYITFTVSNDYSGLFGGLWPSFKWSEKTETPWK